MNKTRRITITPKEGLLGVPKELQSKFAVAAAELLISEGRRADVLSIISGLTASDLIEGPTLVTPVKTTKQRKPNAAQPVAQTAPYADSDSFRKMLQDPDSMPSNMLNVVKNSREIRWDVLLDILITDYSHSENDNFEGALQMLCLDGLISEGVVGDNKRVVKFN